jgi:hypothetical protein
MQSVKDNHNLITRKGNSVFIFDTVNRTLIKIIISRHILLVIDFTVNL